MKLYFAPGTCSMAPHIVLREAGYTFDLEKVDLAKKQTVSGDMYNRAIWALLPEQRCRSCSIDQRSRP